MKNNVITYTVNKTVSDSLYITVQNGEVMINAPWYFTKNRIQEAVEEKRNWILNKIKEYNMKKVDEMSLRPIKIFGIEYNLKVSYKNVRVIECNIYKNIVEIVLPRSCKRIDDDAMTDILIDKMYKKIAERELENIMEKVRINLGIVPEDYEIKEMKDCLAKCTENKKIIINPIIVKYRKDIIEYIVMHEFCHLKYKNHTKRFYEMLKKYAPNYLEYDEELRGINY